MDRRSAAGQARQQDAGDRTRARPAPRGRRLSVVTQVTDLDPDLARDGPELTGEELHYRLTAAWHRQPGLIGWLSTTDHKEIGKRYIVTAIGIFIVAGLQAKVMRLQLAR